VSSALLARRLAVGRELQPARAFSGSYDQAFRQLIPQDAVLGLQILDIAGQLFVCSEGQQNEERLGRVEHRARIRKSLCMGKMTTFLYIGWMVCQVGERRSADLDHHRSRSAGRCPVARSHSFKAVDKSPRFSSRIIKQRRQERTLSRELSKIARNRPFQGGCSRD
jgi:hypothetical protein